MEHSKTLCFFQEKKLAMLIMNVQRQFKTIFQMAGATFTFIKKIVTYGSAVHRISWQVVLN